MKLESLDDLFTHPSWVQAAERASGVVHTAPRVSLYLAGVRSLEPSGQPLGS